MVNLLAAIKSSVPKYVRISRVLRDIPAQFITAGCRDSLRGIVRERMRQTALECRCIRCREFGHRVREGWETGEPHLARMDYKASGGREVFLSFEDDRETLFGLLRMRIQADSIAEPNPGINGATALIRELHVFGPEVSLSERKPEAAQHKGLGKALLSEAERIAGEEFKAKQIAILSGVGARDYYRTESDYYRQRDYMVKGL
jgi:elongator complex protein 3